MGDHLSEVRDLSRKTDQARASLSAATDERNAAIRAANAAGASYSQLSAESGLSRSAIALIIRSGRT